SRKTYRYKKALSFYAFFTMLFSGGLVPTYILITQMLNLKDNIWAMILPMVVSAWYIMLMKGFFQSMPEEILESAKLDGAGELYTFIKIVIPISKPAFATVGLFFVLQFWNDWWLSLLYIETESKFKLQYMLMRLLENIEYLNSAESIQMGLVNENVEIPTLSARMAMCILAAGPILVVFPFFQKYFIKGLTIGSVKG
ncbi:MAG: carbohydrate ABC transporter permease, partial [Oscillospiraceae bacterium]